MAFYNCKNLKRVAIPDGVTLIGNFMCYGCSSLESIEISNNITSIGNYAFTDCKSIKNIVIPKGVTSIGVSAFFWCDSLTNVYYMGTENDWNAISIDSDNAKLKSASRYYYCENQPAESGKYWHYVEGTPTVW